MSIINVEFKARVDNLKEQEQHFLELNPIFKGEDHQIDTYFNVARGRLKLREGNIENALIYYERENTTTAKVSKVQLYKHSPDKSLKSLLTEAHGIKVIVEKRRKIYFIDNVKFHFDVVEGLGTFIEVEAIDTEGNIGNEKLKQQCDYYTEFFSLSTTNFVELSYSDLLLDKTVAGT